MKTKDFLLCLRELHFRQTHYYHWYRNLFLILFLSVKEDKRTSLSELGVRIHWLFRVVFYFIFCFCFCFVFLVLIFCFCLFVCGVCVWVGVRVGVGGWGVWGYI